MFNKIKKALSIILIVIIVNLLLCNYVKADSSGSLYLNRLDFNVVINEDGSMDVTETWNIDISHTNTLYKTFKTDKSKFLSIDNVKVKDVTLNKEFTQINEEMYHVTKYCYYGLENSNGDFEIAWGVGLDNGYDTKTYEISYTVNGAIGKYNDYAELYWQFIGEDFEIDADKITGIITLPEEAENIEDIKVWGHTAGLNGEIYATDNDTIRFQVNNFESGVYVEVRTLFPTQMISNTERIYDENRYDSVIEEETKWANQANLVRKWNEIKDGVFVAFAISVIIALFIIFITKAVKYGKKLKGVQKFKPEQELDYFRELPDQNSTPGEAVYILNESYLGLTKYYGRIFSATLLDLDLKKYIDLRVEKDSKNKEKIYIQKLKEVDDALKNDEKDVLEFIYKAISANKKKTTKNVKKEATDQNKTLGEEASAAKKIQLAEEESVNEEIQEIEIKELEKYISSHSTSVESLTKKSKEAIENQLEKAELIDNKGKEEFLSYKNISTLYFLTTYMSLIMTAGIAFPLSIVFLINGILCHKLKKSANPLTQKGVNIKEKWKGLKKYMEDFSLLNEKEIPAIEVWEHYLVYATAFGIADKVLDQLKTVYPNIDSYDTLNTSAYMYFMYHSNFSTNFSSAINSSISSAYSSGSGGGGGFSGGGGGGRWPEEAEEEDNPRK